MSSSNRTTAKGGKGSKTDKTHKSEKTDSGKSSGGEKQNNIRTEDPDVKEKVKQLMEMSQRPEDDVCLVLFECDYDLNLACNKLLEAESQGEWEMRVKKKKSRQLSTSKQDNKDETNVGGTGAGGGEDWNDINTQTGITGTNPTNNETNKEKGGRGKGNGPPPRLHGRHNDSRGWRGREKQENERNLENGRSDRGGGGEFQQRRGRSSGSTRPGGGRGRGGGRAGGRYPPRGGNRNNSGMYKPIDTWDNSNTWDNNTATEANHNPTTENWDDFPGTDEWTTEEYTGSLADTKVFTPSVQTSMDEQNAVQDGNTQQQQQQAASKAQNPTAAQLSQQLIGQQQANVLQQGNPVPIVGTLNAAQTQYLSQLTQQTSENMSKQYGSSGNQANQYGGSGTTGGGGTNAQVYNSATSLQYNNQQQYGGTGSGNSYNVNSNYDTNSYGGTQDQVVSQPPTRAKTQRARVPPPSKIPSSAVEMPGDLNSSIGYLDVQFGAMDLIDSNSFDSDSNKYSGSGGGGSVQNSTNTTNLDNTNTAPQQVNNLDLNTSNVVQNTTLDGYSQKSSISSTLTQNTNEHLGGVYAAATARNSTQGTTGSNQSTGLDINKSADGQSYTQSTNYNSYQQKSNTYNSTTYSPAQTTTSSYVSNQANSYVNNNQSGTYNPSSGSNYQNTYSSTTSSYQSNANSTGFPSISQANSFPPNNQNYPQNTSQSVYSGNTGLSSSNFGNTSTSQYNSYSSANSHKLNKDNSYENSTNSVTSSQTTTTSNVTSSTSSLSISQTTLSSSKTTTTLTAKNSNSVVSNIPPGVTPVMSTPYIMGQVPYFQQPIPYSYEEMQLLQQRMPHMTTPYYDMSYQTPTTLAAVRDGTLSNVGYSTISDGRFTRGDNNASPVPSTLSQQTSTLTQGHQAQPILAGTAAPYFFAAPFNTIPNYQFGTMYTQLPAATNAHGSSNSNQYSKPATYGSGYGTYDALSQTQDYTKAGYVGSTQGQKGSGANASSTVSTGSDLSGMYPKSHTALGKVNSYEKQGFHSGTPPPQILHGNHNAGLTPSGTAYPPQVYIPTMAPHQQHHSTPLMHQPLHQDSGNSSGQRSQTANQAKASGKQPYPTSYWNQA